MKNKGFTLVELLAVIVVLAIISIITIPMIGNVIDESKRKALEVSANGLVEAANYFTISNDGVYEFVFDKNKKGETIKGEQLDYKGNIEGIGKLYIDAYGDISLCLVDDKYYVYKNYNSGIYVGEVKDNSCIIGYDVLTNKYVAMLDDGTGQISNVYSKDEVNNLIGSVSTNVTNNTNDITSIKESINTLAAIVNNNTNTTTTNTSEISSIKENINTLTATVDNNTNIIAINKNEISNIKGTIETLQSNLNDYALQSSLNTTNNNLNNLSSVVGSHTNNINSLQTSINNLNSNLFPLIINAGDFTKTKDSVQATLEHLFENLPVGRVEGTFYFNGVWLFYGYIYEDRKYGNIISYHFDAEKHVLTRDDYKYTYWVEDVKKLLDGNKNITIENTLYSNFLTSNNKQVIGSESKNVYVGNIELDEIYFQRGGKTISLSSILNDIESIKNK